MTLVYLSLGSNIDREKNISGALSCLEELFGKLNSSSVYESEPVGFEGSCFYNLVVEINTEKTLVELSRCLKNIEDQYGRLRGGPRFSPRTLDIDVITYGDLTGNHFGIELPRPELYYNGFVLQPMAELVPHQIDPESGLNYKALWEKNRTEIEQNQRLWVIDFKSVN